MAKLISSQTNFTAGEISPRLYGHTDTTVYKNGLSTATNVIVTPHGPVHKRNGSKFISRTKSVTSSGNANAVKLLKFQFSNSDGVVLEFGDPDSGNPYIRFYASQAQVTDTALTITGITQANPAVVTTSSDHGLSAGDNVYISGVVGMTEINRPNKEYQVGTVGSSTTFQVKEIGGANINSSAYTAYSSGGSVSPIYEIVSPYDIDDIDALSYVQFGNTIYIAHPSYAPRKLTRTSNTSWSLTTIEFSPPATVELGYSPDTSLTPSADTGTSVNFTAGSATFLQGDVGRQIINTTPEETGKAIITSITSSTVAVCDIVEDFTDTNAILSGDWKMDLSPKAQLEFNGYQSGSIIRVNAKYPVGFEGPDLTITGITQSNPGVITSASHGLSVGDRIKLKDIVGMSILNNREYLVRTLLTNTIDMDDPDTGADIDTSGYGAYSSGGIINQIFTGIKQDTFRSDDVGKYILVNDGVLKIVEYVAATEVKCQVLKAMSSKSDSENWTIEEEDWTAARGYPRCVGLFQERLVFGGTESRPTTLYFSETGIFDGFGVGSLDTDAIIIDVSSKEVNQINWLSNSRDLVVGTSGSELTVSAPSSTTGLSPSNIEVQTRTYHGSSTQSPVNVSSETLFIQGSTRKIRTFRYDFNLDGYTGEDLNFYAEHLTEGGIKEIAYAQEPDSIIYAVTNSGDMLVGTYVREQKILGWSKFTTDGSYENVQVISNGTRDEVWVTVKRTIDSIDYRYVELFDLSTGEDPIDGFSDSYLVYSSPITVTGITQADPAVVTAASHGFSNGDRVKIIGAGGMTEILNKSFLVANATTNTFEVTDLQGNNIDSTAYTAYTSGGEVHQIVNTISGLDHLEGETVQIKADGAVIPDATVSSGSVTLNGYYYDITIGMPYTATITTLKNDFDIGLGSMQGQRSRYIRPIMRLYKSSLPLVDGNISPSRSGDFDMDESVPLFSGDLEIGPLNWSSNGQMTVTSSDPLPLRLSAIFGAFEGNLK